MTRSLNTPAEPNPRKRVKFNLNTSNRKLFIARLQLIGMGRDRWGAYTCNEGSKVYRIKCRKMTFIVFVKGKTYRYDESTGKLTKYGEWFKLRTTWYADLDRELLVESVGELITRLIAPLTKEND